MHTHTPTHCFNDHNHLRIWNVLPTFDTPRYICKIRNCAQCIHTLICLHGQLGEKAKWVPLSHLAIPSGNLANSRGLTPILMRAINIRNGLLPDGDLMVVVVVVQRGRRTQDFWQSASNWHGRDSGLWATYDGHNPSWGCGHGQMAAVHVYMCICVSTPTLAHTPSPTHVPHIPHIPHPVTHAHVESKPTRTPTHTHGCICLL
ncbi:uncharacterized protein LOC116802098 isoform X2 [Drosophila sechellia]|uniref:uncharacterized protein LOC116802098 isoform X2 n=1 Tax=Drosophila sechellia TaxID=7238 RepID=UPI0013DE4025|nr:uncharacterized protein LOC116802098 isoform X2 [Drosophila sechellia]